MTSGWAFLVARGRRQGHRARLVPGVLKELGVSGVVEELAGALGEPTAGPVLRQVPLPDRRMTIAYQTHRIRPEDLAEPAGPVRDEHGRPLDIIYGFICLDGMIEPLNDADLRTALQQALASYRAFLDDESSFVTQTSLAFPLRSGVIPFAPGVVPFAPAAVVEGTGPPPRPFPVRIAVVVGAVAVLAAAVGAVLALVPGPGVDLAGTWAGQDDLGAGQVTVTVTCKSGCANPRDATIGTVSYGACTHDLTLDKTADGVLHAEVKLVSGTDCRPDGNVSLRRAGGDTASLDWSDPGTGAMLLQVPALSRIHG
jgi:hypothetical protein